MKHIMTIKDWRPATLNKLIGSHWATAGQLKALDRSLVGHAVKYHDVPKATSRRRVDVHIVLKGRQQKADVDAYWKSLLDALVQSGALGNDTRQWCMLGDTTYSRGDQTSTTITLTDLVPESGAA